MQEAAETLPETVRGQTDAYAAALIERFENPNLHHRLDQIAMDGSQKLPIRILATLKDRGDKPSPGLQAALSAWVGFVRSQVAVGTPLNDPEAERLVAACAASDPVAELHKLIGA